MSNPFQELEDNGKTPPPRLRNKILGSYAIVNGVAKIAELFMGNFAYTVAEVVKLFDKQLNKEENTPKDPESKNN
ncbi:hypothetical protein C7N43_25115 [Sphingobacteriales bacterium UPWRP_1]|nr:hypothetical protein BVG80_17230 [Sphingobacteriales bacterium TSM_CSM]PSJ74241.1 hypothetical protein C7N43_25115 [Sphingobacteriales bacterium UPWRP_1]